MSIATPGFHIEHLFATTIGVETPPPGTIDSTALLGAAIATIPASGSQSMPVWNEEAGGVRQLPVAPLVAHVRRVVDRMTVDTRTGAAPRWRVHGVLHRFSEAAQPELPPRYDAFWTVLYILDDGFAQRRADDRAAGGEIRFCDPRLPAPMMEAPSLRLRMGRTQEAEIYRPEVTFQPLSGQIFIVPSWLRVRQDARTAEGPRWLIELAFVAPPE